MFVFVCARACVCMQQCACYQCTQQPQYGRISVPSTVLHEKVVVIQNRSSDVWSASQGAKCECQERRLEEARWEVWETDGHIWEVVSRSVQHNLTWTMSSSHSGAEFFSPGAMAEALLRVTSENSAGFHLGS